MRQSTLFKALEDPTRYPGTIDRVQRLDTHISCILLAGSRAYKVKKAVDLGFLDFSTLERRRHYCDEELRLNRRLAPELYLGVIPITGSAEDPVLDGSGEPIEYAVVMRRFRQSDLLPAVLERGELNATLIDSLAALIARFHGRAAVAADGGPRGRPDAILGHMLDNFRSLESTGSPAWQGRLARLEAWTRERSGALRSLLERRLAQGFVRECHGDMHLGNIARWRGEPLVFDGIEFDPDLYWIDVLSEVAFLTMDLGQRGAPALARRFLDGYLSRTGDYGALELHGFYEVYRALVRAKVGALTAAGGHPGARRDGCLRQPLGYIDRAEIISRGTRPALCITHGLSGSGKSTAAARLVTELGYLRLRSDVERKRLAGLEAGCRSGSGIDAGLYSPALTRRTYRRLADLAEGLLSAGRPVVVDATFLESPERRRFAAIARRAGVPFRILALRAEPDALRRRIDERRGDASEADLDVLTRQLERPHELDAMEAMQAVIVDGTSLDSGWIRALPDPDPGSKLDRHYCAV